MRVRIAVGAAHKCRLRASSILRNVFALVSLLYHPVHPIQTMHAWQRSLSHIPGGFNGMARSAVWSRSLI